MTPRRAAASTCSDGEDPPIEEAVRELESAAVELGSMAKLVQHAEVERRRVAETLDAVLSVMPTPVVVVDAERRIVAWSAPAVRRWPAVADEGRRLRSLVEECGAAELRGALEGAWSSDRPRSGAADRVRWVVVGDAGAELVVLTSDGATAREGW